MFLNDLETQVLLALNSLYSLTSPQDIFENPPCQIVEKGNG